MVEIEHHPDQRSFCAGPDYQRWLVAWSPPPDPGVDLWVDSELELWRDTPRHCTLTRRATRLPFYFLAGLEIGTLACVDVGCGHNWFKRFHPTVWGVDPGNSHHRDELLTPEWWIPNWGRWPRACSINAMHFCDQAEVHNQIAKVRGLLGAGGRAFVALNRARIRDRTPDYQEDRLRSQLADTPGLTRMVWVDQPADAGMDGNVWLWIRA